MIPVMDNDINFLGNAIIREIEYAQNRSEYYCNALQFINTRQGREYLDMALKSATWLWLNVFRSNERDIPLLTDFICGFFFIKQAFNTRDREYADHGVKRGREFESLIREYANDMKRSSGGGISNEYQYGGNGRYGSSRDIGLSNDRYDNRSHISHNGGGVFRGSVSHSRPPVQNDYYNHTSSYGSSGASRASNSKDLDDILANHNAKVSNTQTSIPEPVNKAVVEEPKKPQEDARALTQEDLKELWIPNINTPTPIALDANKFDLLYVKRDNNIHIIVEEKMNYEEHKILGDNPLNQINISGIYPTQERTRIVIEEVKKAKSQSVARATPKEISNRLYKNFTNKDVYHLEDSAASAFSRLVFDAQCAIKKDELYSNGTYIVQKAVKIVDTHFHLSNEGVASFIESINNPEVDNISSLHASFCYYVEQEIEPALGNLINRKLTQIINRQIRANIALKNCRIDNFYKDWSDLYNGMSKSEKHSNIIQFLNIKGLDEIKRFINNILINDDAKKYNILNDDIPEGIELDPPVVFSTDAILTYVNCNFSDFKLSFDPYISALITEEHAPVLMPVISILSSKFSSAKLKQNFNNSRVLIMTKDSVVLELSKSFFSSYFDDGVPTMISLYID